MPQKPFVTVSFNTQIAPPATIGVVEIAALLHMQPKTFQKRRAGLMRAGMPRPIPGLALLWSRPVLMSWIHGNPALAGSIHDLPEPPRDPVELHRAALEAKMAGGRR